MSQLKQEPEEYNSNTDAYEPDPMIDLIQEAYS